MVPFVVVAVTPSHGGGSAMLPDENRRPRSGVVARATDPRFEQIVERDVLSGLHENPEQVPGWFTTAYFHHPDEVRAELADAGWSDVDIVATEGPATNLADVDSWLDDDERREALLRAIRRVEREPTVLGASSHLFVSARHGASGNR